MDWDAVSKSFPVNQNYIWLNNCGITPAGEHVVSDVTVYMNDFAQNGYLTRVAGYKEVRVQIKSLLKTMLNCHSDELALIHNTAEGMNYISHGLDLQPGDQVLLLENEYPSNVYPWRHLNQKGIQIDTLPVTATPEDFFDNLCRMLTRRTRVVSVSAVHWCTGMPLPLERIGQELHRRNIAFVVDGAQGVGLVPIDVKAAHISYMAFSAWKWLMGPVGVGILYVAKEKLETLKPIFIGTESVIDAEEYIPYKSELKRTCDRFTISTGNVNDWVYFRSALKFLSRIGVQRAQQRIYELAQYLVDALKQAGFSVAFDRLADYPTGIVACEQPKTVSKEIVAYLHENEIIAADRLGRVRFSPHIYNTYAQLDRVVDVLSRFKKERGST